MKRLESRKRSTQLDWRWVRGSVGAQSKLCGDCTYEAGLFSAAEARSGSALDAPAARPQVSTTGPRLSGQRQGSRTGPSRCR